MTSRLNQWMLLGLLALGAAWAHAADPVGKVLLASGEAFAERGGQRLPLRRDTDIMEGDVLVTGGRSALQVRFSDESMASLRANSQMRVEAYQYNRSPATDKMNVALLKGGLRTVTGLIGKANQDGFSLKTATSTIGIRGTHFTALDCQNDCTSPDGTPVANGTYGGVTDGRIGVANNTGEERFAQQEYFHVADRDSRPQRLLAPPGILSDRNLAARGRAGGGNAGDGQVLASIESRGLALTTSPQSIMFSPLTRDQLLGGGVVGAAATPTYVLRMTQSLIYTYAAPPVLILGF